MYTVSTSIVSGLSPVMVMTGGVVSAAATTVTVLVTCVASLPATSVQSYSTIYDPRVLGSTATPPTIASLSASTLSEQTAPSSSYVPPMVI